VASEVGSGERASYLIKLLFHFFVFMESPRPSSDSGLPLMLRLTVVHRGLFAFQPVYTNIFLVLALLSGGLWLCVQVPKVAFYSGWISFCSLMLCLGAALFNALMSWHEQQHAGEITFQRGTYTLRLGADTWTLPSDHVRAVCLNISPSVNGQLTQEVWGNELTIVRENKLVTFMLLDVPRNTRAVLASLNVAHRLVYVPWWQQPSGAFISDALKGWPGG
jgi:hypothetical protein